jgi:hypothetical protein
MKPAGRVRAALSTAVLVVALAALSRAPYSPPSSGEATLRLAWRAHTWVRETCRDRSQEELDALPVHMRAPRECTRERTEYRLVVEIDGVARDTLRVAAGGLKGDRPVFVMEEWLLPPGERAVRVSFGPWDDDGASATLRLDTTLAFRRGVVQLVTLDTEGRRLIVRSPATPRDAGGPP